MYRNLGQNLNFYRTWKDEFRMIHIHICKLLSTPNSALCPLDKDLRKNLPVRKSI